MQFWGLQSALEMKVKELCVHLGYQRVCCPLDCICWGRSTLYIH